LRTDPTSRSGRRSSPCHAIAFLRSSVY
jgi:hypothetical protein